MKNRNHCCNRAVYLLCVLALLAAGCENTSGPVKRSWGRMKDLDKLVGNMNDTSFSMTRSLKPRLNALGQPTPITTFEGKYLWIEYVASWCPTCAKQTPQTQRLKEALGNEIVFLTIMTAKSRSYEDAATVQTAKEWADRYGLDPAHVLVADNLWSKTIPEHRLLSPKGHTLFVHVGFLSSEQIRDIIAYYKSGWETWSETRKPAEWMKF